MMSSDEMLVDEGTFLISIGSTLYHTIEEESMTPHVALMAVPRIGPLELMKDILQKICVLSGGLGNW
jgi:hypothetical protein